MPSTCTFCDAEHDADSCDNCETLAALYEDDRPIAGGGDVQYGSRLAVKQQLDGSAMTADFIIVTRQNNEPNLHGNMVQIGKTKFGTGLGLSYHEIARPVLLEHGFDFPFPIGVSEDQRGNYSVKRQGSKTATATVRFSQALPEAELVFAMLDEGTIRMASIGFRILKAMRLKQTPAPALEAGVEDWTFGRGHDFVETLLLEWSIVHSGADAGSLRQCLDAGKVGTCRIPDTLKRSFERYAATTRPQGIGVEFTGSTDDARRTLVTPTAQARIALDEMGVTIPEPLTLRTRRLTLRMNYPEELCDTPALTAALQAEADRFVAAEAARLDREILVDSPNAVDTNEPNDSTQPVVEIDALTIGQCLAASITPETKPSFGSIGEEIASSL